LTESRRLSLERILLGWKQLGRKVSSWVEERRNARLEP
jgi:hypothetical protein